jgi:isoquinoline 1-oxidoreductase beta subunit
MTKHVRVESSSARLSRRQVMIGVAGLSFAFAIGKGGSAAASVVVAERTGKALSPWVSIAPHGTITNK